MVKNHLARLAAPKTWQIARKKSKWIVRPHPGSQKLEHSLPLQFILREMLEIASTAREARHILNQKTVFINKKVRCDPRYGVGLFSLIEIPSLKKTVTLVLNKQGKLELKEVDSKSLSLLKITHRSVGKGGKMQIHCHDGRTILSDEKCKVGDSLIFDLQHKKIKEIIPFEEQKRAYLLGGKHVGEIVQIKKIPARENLGRPYLFVDFNGKEFRALKEHTFVIGDKEILHVQ